MSKHKEYGLILPSKKAKPGAPIDDQKPKNVFGDDSDEDQSTVDWVKQTLKKQSQSSMQQKQSTLVMKKALAEDPTVYQYDELYDDMDKKRTEVKEKAKKEKQAKYMPALLQAAERRNREHEQRIERQVQKEREAEKDIFDDKDVFVTGAYRKKMEEAQRLQEEQDRKDAIDDLTDVTKQKDMSGFYRHLYRQTMEEPKGTSEKSEADLKPKPDIDEKSVKHLSEDSCEVKSPKRDSKGRRGSRDKDHHQVEKHRRYSRSRSRSPKERSHRKSRYDRDDDRYNSRHRERDVRRGYRSRSHDRHRRERYRRRTPESDRYRNRTHHSRSRSEEKIRHRNRDRYFDRSEQNSDRKRDRGNSPKRIGKIVDEKSANKIASTSKVEETSVASRMPKSKENEEPSKTSIWAKRTVDTKFNEALARYLRRKQDNSVVPSTVSAT